MEDLKVSLLCFMSGSILGLVFTFFKLPLPAPPVLPGVIGIFGVWFGYFIYGYFFGGAGH